MIAEKVGDACTGSDAVDCTDEEPSKGASRDGILVRDKGHGAFALVSMLDVFVVLTACLARVNLRVCRGDGNGLKSRLINYLS